MPSDFDPGERELRDYFRVLRRRRWPILAVLVLVLGVSSTLTYFKTPIYQASTQLLMQQRAGESLFDPNTGQARDPSRAVKTEIEVLSSEPVRDAVQKRVGRGRITASQVGDTDVIQVRARSTDPERAAAVANAYAEEYVGLRLRQAVSDVLAAAQEIQGRVSDLQDQIGQLDKQLSQLPPAGITAASQAQRDTLEANLRSQRNALIDQQALFKQRLDQLQVERALKTGGVQIVSKAAVPTQPVEPRPLRTAVLAAILGLMLGIGVAFLIDYLDDTVKSKDEAEQLTGGVPVLGAVPLVATWKDRDRPVIASIKDPSSPAAEAYRSLRTSIQFMGIEHPMQTLQVTSPAAAEGKTTTIANLAIALGRAGQRVILVDCDLRRPRLHDFFWGTNEKGFTSVLLGEAALSEVVKPVPGENNVMLAASGPRPPNPSELLSSRRTQDVFAALQAQADMVIIDCPPVLPVTDAAVLSKIVDATLLVVTAGTSTRKQVQSAAETLRRVNAPIIGTVLNGVTADSQYGYQYQYQYQYRPKDEPRTDGRRRRMRGSPKPAAKV